MEKMKLSKPIMIDGVETKEIAYDFENMKGNAIENAYKMLTSRGHVVTMQESDPVLAAAIFAESAGIAYEDVLRMNAKDYSLAGRMVRNFLFAESEDSQEEKTSEE
jgi:hypothetical protein